MTGRRTVYNGRNCRLEFEMSKSGIRKCAAGPELRAACLDVVVSKAMPFAISISPRSDRTDHLHYADAFVAVSILTGLGPGRGERIGKPPMARSGARLVNLAPHATKVEWGTEADDGAGHRILTRTLQYLALTPTIKN